MPLPCFSSDWLPYLRPVKELSSWLCWFPSCVRSNAQMKGTSSRLSQGQCLGAGGEGPLSQFTAPSCTPAWISGCSASVSPRKQLLPFLVSCFLGEERFLHDLSTGTQGIWGPWLPSSKEMAHLPLHCPWSPTAEQGPCCHFVLTKMSIHMAYSEQWHTLPQGKLSLRLVGDRTQIVVLSGNCSSSYLSG